VHALRHDIETKWAYVTLGCRVLKASGALAHTHIPQLLTFHDQLASVRLYLAVL